MTLGQLINYTSKLTTHPLFKPVKHWHQHHRQCYFQQSTLYQPCRKFKRCARVCQCAAIKGKYNPLCGLIMPLIDQISYIEKLGYQEARSLLCPCRLPAQIFLCHECHSQSSCCQSSFYLSSRIVKLLPRLCQDLAFQGINKPKLIYFRSRLPNSALKSRTRISWKLRRNAE